MRKYLYIFGACLAYVLLSSKSCDSDQEDNAVLQKNNIEKTKESIIAGFEAETLSDTSLRAFEIKAQQKLVDFGDYLGIYYDKTLDPTMKSQAGLMIKNLFVSDRVLIRSLSPNEKDKRNLSLAAFLSSDYFPGYNSIQIKIDSIVLTEPLHQSTGYVYSGSLKFHYLFKAYSSSDTISVSKHTMKVDIFAEKATKIFGADTLRVWGVLLGDMH